jgi:hypothetical protein
MPNMPNTFPTNTTEYLEFISKDYQFDTSSEDYLGFINLDADDDALTIKFIQEIIANPDAYEPVANQYGLTIQSAGGTELIIGVLEVQCSLEMDLAMAAESE